MADTTHSPTALAPSRAPADAWTRVRVGAAVAAAVAITPYLVIKVVWVAGALLGTLPHPREMSLGGWVALNAVTVVMAAAGIALAVALAHPRGRRMPAVPLLGAAWIGAGFLVPMLPFLVLSRFLGGDRPDADAARAADPATMPGWEAALIQGGFAGLGLGLAIALPLYLRDRWPAAVGGRLGDVAGRPRPAAAVAVAGATAVGLVSLFWALGGTAGLAHPEDRAAAWHVLAGCTAFWALAGAWATRALVTRRPAGVPTWLPVATAWTSSGMLFAWSAWKLPLAVALAARPVEGRAWPEHLAVAAGLYGVGIVAGAAMLATLLGASRRQGPSGEK